jgi:hypothetical protein
MFYVVMTLCTSVRGLQETGSDITENVQVWAWFK